LIDALPRARGVVHVVAVWRPDTWPAERPAVVMRIVPSTPRSDADAFVLALARARADAILTSGSNLRAEPDLVHRPDPGDAAADLLARYRREALGKRVAPRSAVLTRGVPGRLDLRHPLLDAGSLLVVPRAAARALEPEAARRGLEILALDVAGPREAVAALTRERGLRDLTVELGPSASRPLYESPPRVDELWLSTWLEATLPDEVRGEPFALPAGLHSIFGEACTRVERREPSGRWRFERFRREGAERRA